MRLVTADAFAVLGGGEHRLRLVAVGARAHRALHELVRSVAGGALIVAGDAGPIVDGARLLRVTRRALIGHRGLTLVHLVTLEATASGEHGLAVVTGLVLVAVDAGARRQRR